MLMQNTIAQSGTLSPYHARHEPQMEITFGGITMKVYNGAKWPLRKINPCYKISYPDITSHVYKCQVVYVVLTYTLAEILCMVSFAM